jgi:hypothetical protein
MKNKIRILLLKVLYHLSFYEILFYLHAQIWHMKHKTSDKVTIEDIYKFFYLDFLKISKDDCKIVEINNLKLVTRCTNKCPILDLSLLLDIDTLNSCKKISEGPCKFFLRKLDKNIIFIRNYAHIRPYKKDCEETIILKR